MSLGFCVESCLQLSWSTGCELDTAGTWTIYMNFSYPCFDLSVYILLAVICLCYLCPPLHFLNYVFITLLSVFALAFWNLSCHGCRTVFRQWVSSCRFEQSPISSMLLCRSWNSHLPKHQHLLAHPRSPASSPFV